MLKALVSGQSFDVQPENDHLTVDGQPFDWDLVEVKPGIFHILHQNRSYNAEVLSVDSDSKTFTIRLNAHTHTVQIKDRFDLLLDQLGMGSTTATKLNTIKAPMPGLIVDVKVQPGQTVAKGDIVLILEAMKMENIIKAPGDGTVKAVRVAPRENVEKNQVLIEFD
ncbi:MAG: biotin/lipoyl-binding protein [Cytophagaceae bacterium]|nr:biotin/lipoyl-binding protein [Cytophagaceae bacterium]